MPMAAMSTAPAMATQTTSVAATTPATRRTAVLGGAWTQQRPPNYSGRSAPIKTMTGEVRGVQKDVVRTTTNPRTSPLTRSVVSARIQASPTNGERVWRESSEFWPWKTGDRVMARRRSIEWANQYSIELECKHRAR